MRPATRPTPMREMDLREAEFFDILFTGRFVASARDDADDSERWRILFQRLIIVELFADGVLAGEESFRETFVNDDRARFVQAIVHGEGAPAHDRHSKDAEVI